MMRIVRASTRCGELTAIPIAWARSLVNGHGGKCNSAESILCTVMNDGRRVDGSAEGMHVWLSALSRPQVLSKQEWHLRSEKVTERCPSCLCPGCGPCLFVGTLSLSPV
jgi:hypothetical protein